MKSVAFVLFLTLCVATAVLAGGPAQLLGSVEAVYHEDLVTFQVNHADAVSTAIRVYDLETDALIYDSGPREGTLVSWPAGYNVTGSFRYVVTAWNEQGEVVVSQAAVTKNLTPISAISFDTIPGNTKFLGPGEVIVESDLQVGATPGVLIDQAWSTYGGAIKWYEEGGVATHTFVEPDAGGQGGYLYVDGTGASGGYINAQGMGLGDLPQFYVNGTSDFGVYSGSTGDASVVMPASSVSSGEISNEAGVASTLSGSSLAIGTTAANIMVRTIGAPTAGYVFASAVTDLSMSHVNGTQTFVNCSISDTSNTMYDSGDTTCGLSSNAPSGTYNMPSTMHRILEVSAGSHQLYVVCYRYGGAVSSYDRHFDLLFVPTHYGTVTTAPIEGGDGEMEMVDGYISPNQPLTRAEIEAEQEESIAVNLARIQAELTAIQAQADALAAEADNNQP